MRWWHHGHGSQTVIELTPSLPPPSEASGDLRPLDPAELRLRLDGHRLQMWTEAPDGEEAEAGKATASGEQAGSEAGSADADVAAAVDAIGASGAAEGAETGEAAGEAPPAGSPAPAEAEGGAEAAAEAEGGAEAKQGDETSPEEEPLPGWRDVSLVRLFPLSAPNKWISLIGEDGREAGVILDVAALPADSRKLVEDELTRRYLIPEIRRIVSCRDRYDLVEWTVETNRGRVVFLTRHLREQVKRPLAARLILTDVEGNRYDVPDVNAMDADSQRLLEERT